MRRRDGDRMALSCVDVTGTGTGVTAVSREVPVPLDWRYDFAPSFAADTDADGKREFAFLYKYGVRDVGSAHRRSRDRRRPQGVARPLRGRQPARDHDPRQGRARADPLPQRRRLTPHRGLVLALRGHDPPARRARRLRDLTDQRRSPCARRPRAAPWRTWACATTTATARRRSGCCPTRWGRPSSRRPGAS